MVVCSGFGTSPQYLSEEMKQDATDQLAGSSRCVLPNATNQLLGIQMH